MVRERRRRRRRGEGGGEGGGMQGKHMLSSTLDSLSKALPSFMSSSVALFTRPHRVRTVHAVHAQSILSTILHLTKGFMCCDNKVNLCVCVCVFTCVAVELQNHRLYLHQKTWCEWCECSSGWCLIYTLPTPTTPLTFPPPRAPQPQDRNETLV